MTNPNNTSLGYSVILSLPFQEVVERVSVELQKDGFGVITTIDMQAKIKEKLSKDIEEYIILGVCNPNLAYQALQKEKETGLLLPCNVIVYREKNGIVVTTIRPSTVMGVINNPELAKIALEAEMKLISAVDRMNDREE